MLLLPLFIIGGYHSFMYETTVPSVYGIFCCENNKIYVGSPINPQRRYYQHIKTLNGQSHRNAHLQNAWNKYGCDYFKFFVIEEVKDKSDLPEREQFWMDMYDSYNPLFGFNINPTADNRILSDETRRKMSIAMRGKRNALGHKHSKEFCENRSRVMKGENNPNFGKPLSYKHRKRISDSMGHIWQITNPNGDTQIIKGLEAFCKGYNLDSSCMNKVAQGKRSHHKGWNCKKIKEEANDSN